MATVGVPLGYLINKIGVVVLIIFLSYAIIFIISQTFLIIFFLCSNINYESDVSFVSSDSFMPLIDSLINSLCLKVFSDDLYSSLCWPQE